MTATIALLGALFAAQAPDTDLEPAHAANPLYQAALKDGLKVGETRLTLPPPALRDGVPAADETAALHRIAGSERAAADLTRDSVSAPFKLSTRDQQVGDLGVIRAADLWFVVRAGLDDIKPETASGGEGEGKSVEAANMRFSARRLDEADLAGRGIKTGGGQKEREWYVHMTGRLLDRIHVEATDRVTATRSDGSWVVVSRTDPRFDRDKTAPNLWYPLVRKGSVEEPGKPETYPGGVSYVKVSRLATVPGAVLVESHFAFFEPKPWFDGSPILRSKIGIIAQDRIRALRRELAKSQETGGQRSSPGPKRG
jgi:hypothetical protein